MTTRRAPRNTAHRVAIEQRVLLHVVPHAVHGHHRDDEQNHHHQARPEHCVELIRGRVARRQRIQHVALHDKWHTSIMQRAIDTTDQCTLTLTCHEGATIVHAAMPCVAQPNALTLRASSSSAARRSSPRRSLKPVTTLAVARTTSALSRVALPLRSTSTRPPSTDARPVAREQSTGNEKLIGARLPATESTRHGRRSPSALEHVITVRALASNRFSSSTNCVDESFEKVRFQRTTTASIRSPYKN
jgi:hypothetical protein